MVRFVVNWVAVLLIVVGFLNISFFRIGLPPDIASQMLVFQVFAVVASIMAWFYLWPMVWRVETTSEGLTFCTLFKKRFVRWNEVKEVNQRNWGNESSYKVSLCDGSRVTFYSGMDREEDLLSRLDAYAEKRAPVKETGQEFATLLHQGFLLVWSSIAVSVSVLILVAAINEIAHGDLHNALGLVPAACLTIAGILVGTSTVLRAKVVEITGRGLSVKTWISRTEVPWNEIEGIHRLPWGKTRLITFKKGLFFLGPELREFYQVVKQIESNAILIGCDKQPPLR